MARRRYRRFYKRRSGKWSPNLQVLRGEGTAPATETFADFITIAQNNTSTSQNSIAQVFTVKNVEVSAELEATGSIQNVEYYIMFVPEGYALSADLPEVHTEWIMAYKYIGTPVNSTGTVGGAVLSNAQPPKIRTRLSRKLNTGDQIVFIIRGYNTTSQQPVYYHGLVRWWTKAN